MVCLLVVFISNKKKIVYYIFSTKRKILTSKNRVFLFIFSYVTFTPFFFKKKKALPFMASVSHFVCMSHKDGFFVALIVLPQEYIYIVYRGFQDIIFLKKWSLQNTCSSLLLYYLFGCWRQLSSFLADRIVCVLNKERILLEEDIPV